jgi:hypothetical protein
MGDHLLARLKKSVILRRYVTVSFSSYIPERNLQFQLDPHDRMRNAV